MEHRILIHTPVGKDARHVGKVLERVNIAHYVCLSPSEVIHELNKGAAALLMVEETLNVDFLKSITQFLQKQRTWSDLPILLLCNRGLDSSELRSVYQRLGNVTLLERPLKIITLVTTVSSAIRARKRQYDMREVDRRKDEFLAMLAHELRNPLAPISAASHLLTLDDLNQARVNQASEIILRQVSHMTALIDDLLDMSRVSRGLIELESEIVDVSDIVTYAVEQVLPLIINKSHRLSVASIEGHAYVKGDQKRLIQILSNLLNNAAKYTPEGGDIKLNIAVQPTSVMISVTDTGLGIAEDLVDSIFDMFTQAKRTSDRSQGGLGIGLALVKSLVGLHEGIVTAHSDGLGLGSTFTFILPRIDGVQHASTATTPVKPAAVPATRRLLVVDDNVDAADSLSLYLESFGYQVFVEHNAKDALATAFAERPDVCLLDIGLPDMDGNDLARLIRMNADTSNTILIAITGYGQQGDLQRTKEAGFDHHFVKPVDIEQLLKILQDLDAQNGH